ncbi:MAG: hypothetical protein GY820_42830 [Gammaproteobacteria bacterium]|nr:hypothetical protein [Gammaproteobacteria bacterium]
MEETINIDGNEFLETLGLQELSNGKVGHILAAQLIQYQYSGSGNPREVAREIHHLDRNDGLSKTKRESKFTTGKLKGFYHKHYFTAQHIPFNMLQHNVDGNTGGLGKAFDRVYKRTVESKHTDNEKAMTLANFLTMDAYQHRSRSKKLTGDWIIFKKHNGKKYYLCLSSHQENTDELYEMVKEWYEPIWPFLFTNKI